MDKIYCIFAGVNGVGKSTLYHINRCKDLGIRINNDEILREFGGDWKKREDQIKALLKAMNLIKICIEKGLTFNHETILTGDSYSFVKKIKNNGYKICMHYIGVERVDIAIDRVKIREMKGGHGVKESDIRRRYNESFDNFKKIISLCDNIYIYDNSDKFKRVAEGINGKITDKYNYVNWFDNIFMDTTNN